MKKVESAPKPAVDYRCMWCGEMLADELRSDGSIASSAVCPACEGAENMDEVRGLWRRR